MLDEAIRIRDRYQLEIKLNYPLQRERRVSVYALDTYIFIPPSLGINRSTYNKTDFYTDLQGYIRFKTPSVPLTRIASGMDCPLAKLKEHITRVAHAPREQDIQHYENQIKLFCNIVRSSLRDFVNFIGEISDLDDRERLISEYLQGIRATTAGYRELHALIQMPKIPAKVLSIYRFADEYISLLVEDYSYRLLETLRHNEMSYSRDLKQHMLAAIEHEVNHRKNRQYPSIPTRHSDNEQLLYRRSVFKKYMGNVLFLDTRLHKEGRWLEQGLFGVAAGFSMIFATGVAYYYQSLYGALTMPVFVALVISYIFKDRIKELLRIYFSRKVSGRLFDHKTKLYVGSKHHIGVCRESVDFIEEAQVPEDIRRARNKAHLTEMEDEWSGGGERVIYYRKHIKLFPEQMSTVYHGFNIEGINDIMRFNVLDFVRKTGIPKKPLFIVDGDDYRSIKGDRVYHLNVIVKYGAAKRTFCNRFRIVFNRRRIKRIETVPVESG